MDENKKKFIPQLAIDTEFFHRAFVKGTVQRDGSGRK